VQRGSPFVADLRVQWIELENQLNTSKLAMPEAVQIIGDRDDIVSAGDSIDVASSRSFVTLSAPHSGHRDLIHFDGDFGGQRAELLTRALSQPSEELRKSCITEPGT